MNLKISMMLSFLLFAAFANAQGDAQNKAPNYDCLTKANSDLGFSNPMQIWLAPPQVAGEMVGSAAGHTVAFGVIMEIENLKKGDTKFEILRNIYHSPDLSGVEDVSRIERMVVYTNHAMYDDESSVIKYYQGSHQIGGTVVIRGSAIACVP